MIKTEEKFPELFNTLICEDYDARYIRNKILDYTDYAFLEDSTVKESLKNNLKTYRQYLRDIPAQKGFPRNVDWGMFPLS